MAGHAITVLRWEERSSTLGKNVPKDVAGLFKGANALASITEVAYDLAMRGNGSFGTAHGAIPPALAFNPRPEVLAALVDNPNTVITREKMLEVQAFMASIPAPGAGAHDAAKAALGKALFEGKAGCSGCHPASNEPEGRRLHGTCFHDTSAATLLDVLDRFDERGGLGLAGAEKESLVEYLKSL